jgi:release factor glutamine methyltransferase
MNARQAARELTRRLAAAGVPEAPFEAELLTRRATGLSRAEFFAGGNVDPEAAERLHNMAVRREGREPAAYISGEREFHGMLFEVGPTGLVPRPETELLVELALAEGRPGDVIVDVGTGTGCIAVALSCELQRRRTAAVVVPTDISTEALTVAARNARRNGTPLPFVRSDLLAAVGRADIVLANLPYIPSDEIDALEPEVSQWEPRIALDGGADGFALIRRLVADCALRIRPRMLALEVGFGQAASVAGFCREAGAVVHVMPDLAGIDRVVCCRWR